MPRGSFGAEHWITYYYTLDTFNWPTIDCDGPPGSGCPGTFIEQVDFRHVSNGAGANSLVDPDLKPIRAQEFTLGADHELDADDVDRRPLRAQVAGPDDRGCRHRGAGCRRGVLHLEPGRGHLRKPAARQGRVHDLPEPAEAEARLRRPRVPPHQAALEPLVRERPATVRAASTATTPGLASSDENGRNSPSVNRFFDGQYMSFDQTGDAGLRTARHGSAASVQGPGVRTACPGAPRSGSSTCSAAVSPQQQQVTVLGRAGVQPGPQQHGPVAELQPDRPHRLSAGADCSVART